jgi:prophage regulatory protein
MTIAIDIHFPSTGFVRLPQIIGDAKAKPPIPALIPIGRSTWWQWVRDGKAPAPVKLGPRTTAWRAEQILAFVEALSAGQHKH